MNLNGGGGTGGYVYLVYWKKSNPEDKTYDIISTGFSDEFTSSIQTRLCPNTVYCFQIITEISPWGGINGNLRVKGLSEEYSSDVFKIITPMTTTPTSTPKPISQISEINTQVGESFGLSVDGVRGVYECEIESTNTITFINGDILNEAGGVIREKPIDYSKINYKWNFKAVAKGTTYITFKSNNGIINKYLITVY